MRTARTYIGAPKRDVKVSIGERVTVGHAVILEGAVTLEDECLIGIGAALQHGVRVRCWRLSVWGVAENCCISLPCGACLTGMHSVSVGPPSCLGTRQTSNA